MYPLQKFVRLSCWHYDFFFWLVKWGSHCYIFKNILVLTVSKVVKLVFQYISKKMQRYTVYYIWKLLYVFRVVPPPIIRSAYNCIYSIWYLSHRYCCLPLLRQAAVTVWQIADAVDTVICAPDDGVEVPPKTCRAVSRYNKLCKVASCWIYIGIFLRCTDPWTLNLVKSVYCSLQHELRQDYKP